MLYHMTLFTSYNLSDKIMFYAGYTISGLIAFMMIVNISFLVKSAVKTVIVQN